MNHSGPPDPLSRTLASWQVTPPADPNFRPAVWRRIAGRAPENWPAFLRAHLAGLLVGGGLAVGAAGWVGHRMAEEKLAQGRDQMAVSYLVELDPRVLAKIGPDLP